MIQCYALTEMSEDENNNLCFNYFFPAIQESRACACGVRVRACVRACVRVCVCVCVCVCVSAGPRS